MLATFYFHRSDTALSGGERSNREKLALYREAERSDKGYFSRRLSSGNVARGDYRRHVAGIGGVIHSRGFVRASSVWKFLEFFCVILIVI